MFATVHTASALLIASKISNPWWIFFIGIISHYLIDLIPHGDRYLEDGLYENNQNKKKIILKIFFIIFLDLSLSLSLVLLYLSRSAWNNWRNILLAVLAVLLPDSLMGLAKISRLLKLDKSKNFFIRLNLKIYNFHIFVHNYFPSSMKLKTGLIIQILLTIIFIVV